MKYENSFYEEKVTGLDIHAAQSSQSHTWEVNKLNHSPSIEHEFSYKIEQIVEKEETQEQSVLIADENNMT